MPWSSSSRVTAVTVAGLRPSVFAICVRAIGPDVTIIRKIAERFRSRVWPDVAVR
jgi:hypothetical protein